MCCDAPHTTLISAGGCESMGNVQPQRLECSTNAGTAQQDLANSAAEERQSVFYRSRVTNCSSADFSKKPAGTSDDFAWARERDGMISVKVSAFSENTTETCGENGRGKEKRGNFVELIGDF